MRDTTIMVGKASDETTKPLPQCAKCGAVEVTGNGVTLTTCGVTYKDNSGVERQAECTTAMYCVRFTIYSSLSAIDLTHTQSMTCKNAHMIVHSRVCGRKLIVCMGNLSLDTLRPFASSNQWSSKNEAPQVEGNHAFNRSHTYTANGRWPGMEPPRRLTCPSTELIGAPLSITLINNSVLYNVPQPMSIGDLLMTNPDTGYPSQCALFSHYRRSVYPEKKNIGG